MRPFSSAVSVSQLTFCTDFYPFVSTFFPWRQFNLKLIQVFVYNAIKSIGWKWKSSTSAAITPSGIVIRCPLSFSRNELQFEANPGVCGQFFPEGICRHLELDLYAISSNHISNCTSSFCPQQGQTKMKVKKIRNPIHSFLVDCLFPFFQMAEQRVRSLQKRVDEKDEQIQSKSSQWLSSYSLHVSSQNSFVP